MALIQCPECGKEVSDRAYSCPHCGFPIDEYLEEEQQKKEIEKEENHIKSIITSKEYQQLSEEITFSLGEKNFCCTNNQKLNWIIDNRFNDAAKKTIKEFVSMFDPPKSVVIPTDYEEHGYITDCLMKMSSDIVKVYAYLYKKYIIQEEDEQEIYNNILSTIENYEFWDVTYEKLHECYQRTIDVLDSYSDDIDLIQMRLDDKTKGDLINAVYSTSLTGLIKGTVEMNIVNALSNSLVNAFSGDEDRIKDVEKQYYIAQVKGAADFFKILIIGLGSAANEMCMELKHIMVEDYKLIEAQSFILSRDQTFESFSDKIDEAGTKGKKYELFSKAVFGPDGFETWPYISILCCLDNVQNDIDSIFKIADFFDCSEKVTNQLKTTSNFPKLLTHSDDVIRIYNNKDLNDKNFNEEDVKIAVNRYDRIEEALKYRGFTINDTNILNSISFLRTVLLFADGMVFDSEEDKKNYLTEKNKYQKLEDEINNCLAKTDIKTAKDVIVKYELLGEPKNNKLQEKYLQNINYYKSKWNENGCLEAELMASFIKSLGWDGGIYSYSVFKEKDKLDSLEEIINTVKSTRIEPVWMIHKKLAEPNECLAFTPFEILYIKGRAVCDSFMLMDIHDCRYKKGFLNLCEYFYFFAKEIKISPEGITWENSYNVYQLLNKFSKEHAELYNKIHYGYMSREELYKALDDIWNEFANIDKTEQSVDDFFSDLNNKYKQLDEHFKSDDSTNYSNDKYRWAYYKSLGSIICYFECAKVVNSNSYSKQQINDNIRQLFLKYKLVTLDDGEYVLDSHYSELLENESNPIWDKLKKLWENVYDSHTESSNPTNNKTSNSLESWKCKCGKDNNRKFCTNCGLPKPVKISKGWICSKCGKENTMNFCTNCGTKRSMD